MPSLTLLRGSWELFPLNKLKNKKQSVRFIQRSPSVIYWICAVIVISKILPSFFPDSIECNNFVSRFVELKKDFINHNGGKKSCRGDAKPFLKY
jgi:hypothetical protein